MPYIKKEYRPVLDIIADMILIECGKDIFKGRMNYLLHKLVKEYVKEHGESYNTYKEIIGELECAKAEIQRRMVAPYEDKKILENGDVE